MKNKINLTHPERIVFPKPKLSKADLFEYYQQIAPWILPYVKNRLISVVRCPQGISKQCFFQRHENIKSDFIFEMEIEEKNQRRAYIYIKDENGLLELVQFGAIEIHIWGSTIKNPHLPNQIVFDLDPSEEVAWKQVVEAAADIKLRLDKIGLQSFLKTTGGKGLHVTVPIKAEHDFEIVKNFSKNFALQMQKDRPENYLVNMSKEKRLGKIFIDYLRNEFSATSILPYSARAREDATVSTLLSWEELDYKLNPKKFTIETVFQRVQKLKKDPWEGFFECKQKLSKKILKDFQV